MVVSPLLSYEPNQQMRQLSLKNQNPELFGKQLHLIYGQPNPRHRQL